MADDGSNNQNQLAMFMKSGIYRFDRSNAVFFDPVRVLNRSYSRFRVLPSVYYSRFFDSVTPIEEPLVSDNPRKRKRKVKKTTHLLNEREQIANQRHQNAKPFLVKAHESLLGATELLAILPNMKTDEFSAVEIGYSSMASEEESFLELGSVWQAPLYEITLNFHQNNKSMNDGGCLLHQCQERTVIPIFNRLVANETNNDVEAEFLNRKYILPNKGRFYMSDLKQIHNLIPAEPDCGFNLIVIDPPWENSSAYQKMKYPTVPNRYFLSLPVKQLAHAEGALIALWITNKEKLRVFVENELFPKWGVKYLATHYWLKVKADSSLIGELDLFHHRPYECLLLGYCQGEAVNSECLSKFKSIPDDQVVISIPGDYSRKPPIGELLLEYVPGSKPARCIELFAREMIAGWTSWGNEPLRFQDLRYFSIPRTEILPSVITSSLETAT